MSFEKNREALRNDPAALRKVVDQHLLPHFDTDYAGQLVLGKHWRQATAAQRKRFVDAFYQSLMRNYGEALLEFTADRMKILPFKGDPNASSATVRTPGAPQQRYAGAGQLQPAKDSIGLEGVGRHYRGHLVRKELPQRHRRGGRTEGSRFVRSSGLRRRTRRPSRTTTRRARRRRRPADERLLDRLSSARSPDGAGRPGFRNAPAALAHGLALLGDAKDCEIRPVRPPARVTARGSPCSSNGSRARGGGARPCATREFRSRCAPSRESRTLEDLLSPASGDP